MNCKNCNTPLMDVSKYCNICGAKVIKNRLTIRNLFATFMEQFLSYDNKFLRTSIDLIKKPELVINGYVGGIRKKYIDPISFFAISLTVSGLYLFVLQKYFPETMDFSQVYDNQTSQKLTDEISSIIMDYNSLLYFAIIPLLGLISLIVFYNKKFNYSEHIVIYLYTMSLSAIITSVIALFLMLLKPEVLFGFSLASNAILILFHCYLLKRVFNLSITQLILKFLLFMVVFGISYFIISIAMVFVILAFTDMTLQDLAPPK